MLNIIQWKRKKPATAVAGTAIELLIDPNPVRGRSIITRMSILVGATAHTLTVMQVLSKHVTSAAALGGQKVIAFADESFAAANDILAIKMPNGRYEKYHVTSVDAGAHTVTLTENLSAAIPANTPVCFFGVVGDGHEQVALSANGTTTFESEEGYFGADEMGEPMVLHINNATNASTIQAVNCPIISV